MDDLIARCRGGDRQAYYNLYKLYSRAMYNVGYRIVNNADEAKDVLQDAFISAFNNLEMYRGEAAFGAWLKRIVVNKAINQVRRRRFERLPETENFDVKEEAVVDELEGYPFEVEKVRKAIEQLPDGYRVVLSLYLLEGYDHGEIGEILGITESTSKSQFNRSKKKLKEILEGGSL
ncbi:DNA-directed RNA polymerase sigma-70 factor [Cytophagales bacterium WSM2-2]|nr:DNA-directed RNA polymerase sigma-70 factor [Cytophagales bacterium WSM2-2]